MAAVANGAANANPIGPPRPEAICTFISSDDFLPGAQTLLFSLRRHLSGPLAGSAEAAGGRGDYGSEIVVLATSSVSDAVRTALYPIFCTRVIEVDHIPMPNTDGGGSSHVSAWDANCGLTKLHIFGLEQYSTILYVDADCLVLRDLSHLLKQGRCVGQTSDSALLAAAPDIFPPGKFNAGVLLVRPSRVVLEDIIAKASSGAISSYDGGDTGVLNSYFPNWFTNMEPSARLDFGYNAQRFMHRCTYGKRPQYWEEGIDAILIVHYSSSPKPWEDGTRGMRTASAAATPLLQKGASESAPAAEAHNAELDDLWKIWYRRSQEHAKSVRKREAEKGAIERPPAGRQKQQRPQRQQEKGRRASPAEIDRLVRKKYKELRKKGITTGQAMQDARRAFGLDRSDRVEPGKQVAAMFGMM